MGLRLPLSLPDAVREALLAEIDGAAACLAQPTPAKVHAARKHCKKARAILALLAAALPREEHGAVNALIRDAARAVAARREAAVRMQTLERLSRHEAGLSGELEGLKRLLRRRAPGVHGESAAEALRALAAARAASLKLEWTRVDLPLLESALRSGYRQARRALRRCRKPDAGSELVHEWRKRSKRHAYQCELLSPLWPRMADRAGRLDELNDALGEHHDLADLQQLLECLRAEGETVGEPVFSAIARRQTQDLRTALAFADLLYADKPKRWSPAT